MHGTTSGHVLPKESGDYLKRDFDPDTAHTVIATHSRANINSMSAPQWFLKKSELAPDHMESKLTHCCSYNH